MIHQFHGGLWQRVGLALWLPSVTVQQLTQLLQCFLPLADKQEIQITAHGYPLSPSEQLDKFLKDELRITAGSSHTVAISPHSLTTNKDRTRIQALSTVTVPDLGDFNVCIRIYDRFRSKLAWFGPTNRGIIQLPQSTRYYSYYNGNTIICWPVGMDLPINLESKCEIHLSTPNAHVINDILEVYLDPNYAILGCFAEEKEAFGLIVNRNESLERVTERLVESGSSVPVAWINAGKVMDITQALGAYVRNGGVKCELVHPTDILVHVKDLKGNHAFFASKELTTGGNLYNRIYKMNPFWGDTVAFLHCNQVYSTSHQTPLTVSATSLLILLCSGDFYTHLYLLPTLTEVNVILRQHQRTVQSLKAAVQAVNPSLRPYTVSYTGKLEGTRRIEQYGVKNKATLVFIIKNAVLKDKFRVKVQTSGAKFVYFTFNSYHKGENMKEMIGKAYIENLSEYRLIYGDVEIENEGYLKNYGITGTEHSLNMLFCHKNEWIIQVKIGFESLPVIISRNCTALGLKLRLSALTGYRSEHIQLKYGEVYLRNDCILHDLNVGSKEMKVCFVSEYVVLVRRVYGEVISVNTHSSHSISMLKSAIVDCKALIYHGEELIDSKLVGDYDLRTGVTVTEHLPTSLKILAVTAMGDQWVDLSVHPNTKVNKLSMKLRRRLDISNCAIAFILSQPLLDTDKMTVFFSSNEGSFYLRPQ